MKTIILESGRCAWGKCIFCVMSKKKQVRIKSKDELKQEFLKKLRDYKGEGVKIFNSGTFIDDQQIPREVRQFIFEELRKRGIKKIVIEVWPGFITHEKLSELKEDAKDLEVHIAMGLESANDEVLNKIKKGTTLKKWEESAKLIKRYGFKVRAYVMVNLPYVKDIKQDFEQTMKFALQYADSIAVMNTFAYSSYAELFDMWLKGEWKPITIEEFKEIVKNYQNHPKVEIYEQDYIIYPHFSEEYKEKAKHEIKGATIQNLTHPYYEVWQDFISRFYKLPAIKKYALFMHCSYRKPYSRSQTHRKIISYLQKLGKKYAEIHQLIISNPGVVPREFEDKYPFNAYDWPEYEETEEIKKAYVEVNAKRIENYLRNHQYEKIFVYLKPGSESLKAFEIAAKKLRLNWINVLDEGRWKDIKEEKQAYVDDILLEKMIEKIRKEIEKKEENFI
ncbi:MAG: radical SAM protein [Candidatus Nanohaloarchaeota archaeon]|nr:radical SAM protein [Candidatus Nanohaloarchaeota archaeon]